MSCGEILEHQVAHLRAENRPHEPAAPQTADDFGAAVRGDLILNMNDLPSLLRNDGGNKQNWIKIKLVGTKCNRTAIGARVRVITGKHIQMDEVNSGTSVMSQSDLRLHFGLGKVEIVDAVEVKWPTTQKIERFTQLKANQILTIREGDGIIRTSKPVPT